MTDRELLELAAKAAGIEIVFGNYDQDCYANITEEQAKSFGNYETGFEWNPLTDDSDVFRLAVKLDIVFRVINGAAFAWRDGVCDIEEPCRADPLAATRRAIVRAAAEIGKGMKNPS